MKNLLKIILAILVINILTSCIVVPEGGRGHEREHHEHHDRD